ncbi:sulfatase [Labilibacter sediminis]|nr:sulfatase [Labilibacter sediminis]
MKKIVFVLIALSVIANGYAKKFLEKPNVVLIFSDDLGWTGLGSFGSDYYETPNLDLLCNNGMKFTQGYATAPVCAPSRAALISGQYAPRNGTYRVTDVPRSKRFKMEDYLAVQPKNRDFELEIFTMAEMFKSVDYTTGMFGKWHIHPTSPGDCGFDKWIASQGAHYGFKTSPHYDVPKDVYLSDFMADHAIEFINENKEQPFFLYLPDFLVHKPHEAKAPLIEKYKKKKPVRGQKDPVYAAMTESLDQTVGRIYQALKENGLLENTLIVFTSDNGANCHMNSDFSLKDNVFTDNLPLREGKGKMYEGGLRVPYIFYWKGEINAGTVCDKPIINVDLYPTFMELAGAQKPDQPLDGESVVSSLKEQDKKSDKRALYWHYPNYGPVNRKSGTPKYAYIPTDVIRYGDYKLLEFYHYDTEHIELYNLKEDIGERNDLAEKMPEKAKELHQMLKDWRKEVGAEYPYKNPDFKQK